MLLGLAVDTPLHNNLCTRCMTVQIKHFDHSVGQISDYFLDQ